MKLLREGRDFATVQRELRDGQFVELTVQEQERARVIQGVTVLLEKVADLDVLEALVGEHIEKGSDYRDLYAAVGSLDWRLPFWEEKARAFSESERRNELLKMIPDEPDEIDPLQTLFLAVNATREIWKAADAPQNLNVTLSLVPPSHVVSSVIWFWIWCWVWLWMLLNPFFLWTWIWLWKPFSPPEAELVSFREPTPVFTFAPGSLKTMLGMISDVTGMKWIVTIYSTVRGQFTTAAKAAQWFVDELRKRYECGKPTLPRMDKLSDKDLQDLQSAKTVVVLVHGLFSTDLQAFDGLLIEDRKNLKAWEQKVDSGFQPVKFVGYPHNSLALIAYNAEDLAYLIDEKLGKGSQIILFVCHSRGGLVARATVNELLKRERWRDRLAGCVTFGTPHKGAKLAKSPLPLRNAAAYVLLSVETKSLVALDKILVYLHHKQRIEGLDDLAPTDNPVSEFLVRLEKHEDNQTKDGLQKGKVFAIGGDLKDQNLAGGGSPPTDRKFLKIWNCLGQQLIGPHDLVVETSSSVPDNAEGKHRVRVDHFCYFKDPASMKLGLEGVRWLLASKSPPIEPPAPARER